MEIKTIMRRSDYEGTTMDPSDCPGHRAFKRACKLYLPWYRKLFIEYDWIGEFSYDSKWKALNQNGFQIYMTTDTKVGDIITFRKS